MEFFSGLILMATLPSSEVGEAQCLSKTTPAETRDTFVRSFVTLATLGSTLAADPAATSSLRAASINCAQAYGWNDNKRTLAMQVWLAETEADALAHVLEKQGFSPITVLSVLGSLSIEELAKLQDGTGAITFRDRLRKSGLNITDYATFRPVLFFTLAVLERGRAVSAFNNEPTELE